MSSQIFASDILTASIAPVTPIEELSHLRWEGLEVTMDDYDTFYFDNRIEHFDPNDGRTYKQRYWKNDKHFDQDDGPIFLYLCGEWTCTPPDEEMFPMMVGAENKARLMSLEHRYYGESQPFDDLSTDNLKWLTAWEALADISTFIEAQNKELGRKAEWVIVGGSYPGALAAWFKSIYPDHAVAAWSSSGVINAIEKFDAFDRDLYDRANESRNGCANWVRNVIEHVEDEFMSTEGTKRVCKAFKIDPGMLNK